MKNDKIKVALELSEQILENLEDSEQLTSVVLLKCMKLARYIEDYDAVDWLLCETEGYKGNEKGIDSKLFEIGIKHGRETKPNDKGNKTMFTDLAGELEKEIISQEKLIGSYTTSGVSVGGEGSLYAMNSLVNSVSSNNSRITNNIASCQKKLYVLRSEYYKYALNINIQLKFSEKIDDIFGDYRIKTDNFLADNVPDGIKKLSSIYSRIKENDEESYSQAATTCRKLLINFIDSVFYKLFTNLTENSIKLKSGKEFDITGDHYLNRLYVIIDKVSLSKMKEDNILQTCSWCESINDRICKGLHRDISLNEIRDTIMHLYILMGDIINAYEMYIKNS